jgi:DNA polymerase-3 subunit chi
MAAGVEFHTGVADPLGFACRLLRKAYRSGARVIVTGTGAELAALDQALWTFAAQEFIPHVRLPGSASALAARTPIWLVSGEVPADGPAVLINIGADPPPDRNRFERIIEVVGTAPESVAAGRAHWRHYESWGVQPVHHAAR